MTVQARDDKAGSDEIRQPTLAEAMVAVSARCWHAAMDSGGSGGKVLRHRVALERLRRRQQVHGEQDRREDVGMDRCGKDTSCM